MRIFKFGGASIKDAQGVKKTAQLLQEVGYKDSLLVISAMGKTTNAIEQLIQHYFNDKKALKNSLNDQIKFHNNILFQLFNNHQQPVFDKVKSLFDQMERFLAWNKSPKHSFVYDQLVSYGEMLSTTIISEYLNQIGVPNNWIDARSCIKTDNHYRDANVDWTATKKAIKKNIKKDTLYVTQGFVASDENNFTTTLGREGSDYSAAIFAYCLNANSVTIWKDVPGVLNADPRYFSETQTLEQISYREAIELAFYGASVIHPKTLQPLQKKEIPLFVKPFSKSQNLGTAVCKGKNIYPKLPCFIVKKEQLLIRLSSLDFSFIVEKNISYIFSLLHQHKMKVDLIQNSAISFSVCVNDKYNLIEKLLEQLRSTFKVNCTKDVSLYTIRHFDLPAIEKIKNDKQILLEQRTQETIQLVTK